MDNKLLTRKEYREMTKERHTSEEWKEIIARDEKILIRNEKISKGIAILIIILISVAFIVSYFISNTI